MHTRGIQATQLKFILTAPRDGLKFNIKEDVFEETKNKYSRVLEASFFPELRMADRKE